MKEFEYKITCKSYAFNETELNNIGSEGWELVSYRVYCMHEYIFKREKLDKTDFEYIYKGKKL